MTKNRILTTAVIVAILGTLVYLQVQHWRSFDWHRFRQVSHVDPLHILAAVGLIYFTYLLRAMRWKVFLEPIRKARVKDLIGPTFIGFTSLALLGRPGEFIRPYLIAKKEQVPVESQIGVWAVERIFDTGAFTVLLVLDVFFSAKIAANQYVSTFRAVAVGLSVLVALLSFFCVLMLRRGPQLAALMHRVTSRVSTKLAHHVDQKVRAFGEGLNTIAGPKSFLKLVVLSMAIWLLIALSYREVTHAYPAETAVGVEQGPPSVDVETAHKADMPELAGEPVEPDLIEELRPGLRAHGYDIRELTKAERIRRPLAHGKYWLVHGKTLVKPVGDRPHLNDMDISHVLLLMGLSMVGSTVQLPAVGGGSQLAVITGLQRIYGIPPELAVSCGMLLWLVTFMACIPVGLVLAHREHLSLRKLSAESHREEEREAAEVSARAFPKSNP